MLFGCHQNPSYLEKRAFHLCGESSRSPDFPVGIANRSGLIAQARDGLGGNALPWSGKVASRINIALRRRSSVCAMPTVSAKKARSAMPGGGQNEA